MGKLRTLKIVAATLLLSSSAWADAESHESEQALKPISIDGNNNTGMKSEPQHKTITTRERPERHQQHHELSIDYPFATQQAVTIKHLQSGGSHHHRHGVEGEKMESHAMQIRKQHMANMEERLANIEALLEKLVEMQKP